MELIQFSYFIIYSQGRKSSCDFACSLTGEKAMQIARRIGVHGTDCTGIRDYDRARDSLINLIKPRRNRVRLVPRGAPGMSGGTAWVVGTRIPASDVPRTSVTYLVASTYPESRGMRVTFELIKERSKKRLNGSNATLHFSSH